MFVTKRLFSTYGPLIMAKVSSERFKKVVKCGVPKHRFNDLLLMFIRETYDVQALDSNGICKPGDWVLLRRNESIVDPSVTHEVERIIYSYGNWVDPVTGKRSLGLYFDDDIKRLEKIKVDM